MSICFLGLASSFVLFLSACAEGGPLAAVALISMVAWAGACAVLLAGKAPA